VSASFTPCERGKGGEGEKKPPWLSCTRPTASRGYPQEALRDPQKLWKRPAGFGQAFFFFVFRLFFLDGAVEAIQGIKWPTDRKTAARPGPGVCEAGTSRSTGGHKRKGGRPKAGSGKGSHRNGRCFVRLVGLFGRETTQPPSLRPFGFFSKPPRKGDSLLDHKHPPFTHLRSIPCRSVLDRSGRPRDRGWGPCFKRSGLFTVADCEAGAPPFSGHP